MISNGFEVVTHSDHEASPEDGTIAGAVSPSIGMRVSLDRVETVVSFGVGGLIPSGGVITDDDACGSLTPDD